MAETERQLRHAKLAHASNDGRPEKSNMEEVKVCDVQDIRIAN